MRSLTTVRGALHDPLRLLVVNGYGITPLLSGGNRRIKDVYTSLLPHIAVDVLTLGADPIAGGYFAFAEGLRETRVPASIAQYRENLRLIAENGPNVTHPATDRTIRLNPSFVEMLEARLTWADLVVCCHPYLFALVRSRWSGPVIHHSHDVEADIQRQLLPRTPSGDLIYEAVVEAERSCVRDADLTIAMSQQDAATFVARYGAVAERMYPVPPSLDVAASSLPSLAARAAAKRARMTSLGSLVVFLGSDWAPNLVAAHEIVRIAPQFPTTAFVIIGSVSQRLAAPRPANVVCTGYIDDAVKHDLLTAADVALNPTLAASGVNMKMGEYFACGAPIVSTPDGARGLDLVDGEHGWIVERDAFAVAIADALARPHEARRRAERAHAHAAAHLDARKSGARLARRLSEIVTRARAVDVRTLALPPKVDV